MIHATKVAHRTVKVRDLDVFYREAGPKDAPAVLLLHGFPTSSQMFRNLIPSLADRWEYEAQTLIPFIRNGPLTFWMYPVFGLHGASYFLGASEWLTAALLIWGFWNPKAGILGAILSVGTFVTTASIIPFMPDGWDAAAGFPAMKGNVAFLMKDVVLLAASFYLLKQDVLRASLATGEQSERREVGDIRALAVGQVAAK